MKNCGLSVFRGVFVSGLPFFGEMERWVAWNPSWREPFCSNRAAEQLIWNQISSDPSWWLGRPCISHFPFLYFRFPGCKDHEALVGVCWGQHLWCCLAGGHSIPVQNICLQGSLIPKGLFYLLFSHCTTPPPTCPPLSGARRHPYRNTTTDLTAARWEYLFFPGATVACSNDGSQEKGIVNGDHTVWKPNHSGRLLPALAGL